MPQDGPSPEPLLEQFDSAPPNFIPHVSIAWGSFYVMLELARFSLAALPIECEMLSKDQYSKNGAAQKPLDDRGVPGFCKKLSLARQRQHCQYISVQYLQATLQVLPR